MIEVFRFMDSSATSHPVYGIEHSGDAIDTAAIIYLGTSGGLPSTSSDLMVVKGNTKYHIGGWPEEKANNFHWIYNNTKYDIRATFRTTSGNRQYANNEMYVSVTAGSQQHMKIMTGYIKFPNIRVALNTLYTTFGREYRLNFSGNYSVGNSGLNYINKYITKDVDTFTTGSGTNSSDTMSYNINISNTLTLQVLKDGGVSWITLGTLKFTNGTTLGISGSTSSTGSKIYGTYGYFASRAKNLNLTAY